MISSDVVGKPIYAPATRSIIAGLARSVLVAVVTLVAWATIAIYALRHRGQFILGM